jgi:chitin synthase
MLIGWMVVYILSYAPRFHLSASCSPWFVRRYPIYSFFLPIYSFWCMDEFGWGNTRLVIGEGSSKKIVMNEDERFDESMIPLKKFSGTSLHTSLRYGYLTIEFFRVRSRSVGIRHSALGGYRLRHQASIPKPLSGTSVSTRITPQLPSSLPSRRLLP